MAQDAEEPETEDGGSGPLAWWQRALAGLVGVAMTGAGGYSVFKTTNQAGSATLLIFGCIFMISSLNGAQIQGLKLKDSDISWYKTKVRREYAKVAEQEPPQQARKLLDALSTVDPQAARDPLVQRVSVEVYVRQIFEALDRLAGPGKLSAAFKGGPDYGADVLVDTTAGRIAIVVKTTKNGILRVEDLDETLSRAAAKGYPGVLIVTNGRLSSAARIHPSPEAMGQVFGVQLRVVQWFDGADDEQLRGALSDLTTRMAGGPPQPQES